MAKGYRPGRHIVVCDITGERVWDDEVRTQWDGAVVRKQSWSPQHPQELIRVRGERPLTGPIRREPPDQFVQNYYEFGFDDGLHFNFAPNLSDDYNYTKASNAESVRGQAETFWTRTGDAKYFRNANGLLELTAANGMSREFDINGNFLGWLLEPKAKTNLILYAEDWDNAGGWTLSGASAPASSVTTPFVVSTNADKLTESATTAEHRDRQTRATTAGATIVLSCFAKAGERTRINLRALDAGSVGDLGSVTFDLVSGTVVSTVQSGAATLVEGRMERFADGWWRCFLRVKPNATMTSCIMDYFLVNGVATNYAGDGASGLYVTGAMFEESPVGTSYIRTTAASVTRAADRAYLTIGSWFDQTKGTIYARYRLGIGNKGANQFIANFSDNAYLNAVTLLSSSSGRAAGSVNKNNGFAGLSTVTSTLSDRVDIRQMLAYAESDTQGAMGGALRDAMIGPASSVTSAAGASGFGILGLPPTANSSNASAASAGR